MSWRILLRQRRFVNLCVRQKTSTTRSRDAQSCSDHRRRLQRRGPRQCRRDRGPQINPQTGGRLTEITELQIDKKTGSASYCAHGSYCYPTGGIALQGCIIATAPGKAILPEEIPGCTKFVSGRQPMTANAVARTARRSDGDDVAAASATASCINTYRAMSVSGRITGLVTVIRSPLNA
jgi:hypothetical protein